MRFEMSVDGKLYDIEILKDKAMTVTVDGETFTPEVVNSGGGHDVKLEGKVHHVFFEKGQMFVDNRREDFLIRNFRRISSHHIQRSDDAPQDRKGTRTEMLSGVGSVHPPMPGRVMSVKVSVGDKVKVGTPILVLEAMKMQNEIVSPRDGTVREVRIGDGDLVESGDVLVVIT